VSPVRLDADVAVVGLVSMASMAAWQLARDGQSDLGFERFGIGHDRSAVGGESRASRTAYLEGPQYVPIPGCRVGGRRADCVPRLRSRQPTRARRPRHRVGRGRGAVAGAQGRNALPTCSEAPSVAGSTPRRTAWTSSAWSASVWSA